METIRALFIAPYPELAEMAEKVSYELPCIRLETFVGDFRKAIEYATVYRLGSFDVIISRGGIAGALKKVTDVPVIDMKVSPCDILRSIQTARMCSDSFAFVAYHGIAESARSLSEVLRFNDFRIIATNGEESMIMGVDSLLGEADLVVGDMSAVTYAERKGMKTIQLTSSRDSVKNAFDDAMALALAVKRERKKDGSFKDVLDVIPDGILVLNASGSISYTNEVAAKYMTEELRKRLFESTESSFVYQPSSRAYKPLFVEGKRLGQGASSQMIFSIKPDRGTLGEVKSIISETFDESRRRDDFLLSDSEYIRPMKDELDRICDSASPVFIYGIPGTEKSSVARYIHWNGQYSGGEFVIVHCHDLSGEDWNASLSSPSSPIFKSGCTLFFEDVDRLSPELQMSVDRYIRELPKAQKARLICSSVFDLKKLTESGAFNQSLYMRLCPLTITVPPLCERKSDIPVLAGLYVSRFNNLFGKEVAGLTDGAIELLSEYDWQMDMAEFQLAIRRLVEFSDSMYITEDEAMRELQQKELSNTRASGAYIDIDRSLSDIESDIIRKVLESVGMNQSRAAKKLGVSRTTIWRLLKQS